jgi:BirA family transcriptional regulator, biotin operon repressor / biotin---[acetyl-CoA-carboxylase] ligase
MNALTFPLLRFLSHARYRTFSEIGDALGVSADAVSETLEYLVSMGMDIERNAEFGCRLTAPIDWLRAEEIEHHLGVHVGAFQVEVVDHTDSTNADLMDRARRGAASGLVCVAELQTAGRGRRQRAWHSGIGDSLTFSVLWVFASGSAGLSGLSLAVGVSLVRSLQRLGVVDAKLKWPNDILWQQRKLGGVLIETTGRSSEAVKVVIGIGLNLRLSGPVAQRIDQSASDLETAGLHIERNELFGRVLVDLEEVLETYSRNGFAVFKEEWERAHAYQDKMVRLALADGTQQEGRVTGVDDDGALLLSVGASTRKFNGGDLSLRPIEK